MFLKKLITTLILPPGLFIVLIILFSFFVKKRSHKIVIWITACLLYICSITPVKDLFIYFLEKDYMSSSCNGDIIVILGGGVYGNGELSEDAFKRAVKGYLLYKDKRLPIIVSGGRLNEKFPFEADILANSLIQLGVDNKSIFKDKDSRDTIENARFTKKILEEHHFKSVILVTSAYHMKRAAYLFRKVGIENVCPEAADFKFDGIYSIYDFLPYAGNLHTISKALKEYVGLMFYFIK